MSIGTFCLAGFALRGHAVCALYFADVIIMLAQQCTRLNSQKYSIENDTKVQMIHFDLWSVERHPQGVHNLKEHP